MMGLSSMILHFTAVCRVVVSGRRHPTEEAEADAGVWAEDGTGTGATPATELEVGVADCVVEAKLLIFIW
jgi:hypothetical protein